MSVPCAKVGRGDLHSSRHCFILTLVFPPQPLLEPLLTLHLMLPRQLKLKFLVLLLGQLPHAHIKLLLIPHQLLFLQKQLLFPLLLLVPQQLLLVPSFALVAQPLLLHIECPLLLLLLLPLLMLLPLPLMPRFSPPLFSPRLFSPLLMMGWGGVVASKLTLEADALAFQVTGAAAGNCRTPRESGRQIPPGVTTPLDTACDKVTSSYCVSVPLRWRCNAATHSS